MPPGDVNQPPQYTIDLCDRKLRYEVLFSKRKSVELVLKSADFLVIKAPLNVNVGQVAQIVAKRRKWLLKHMTALAAHPYAEKPCFEDGSIHFLLGRPHTLQLQTASAKRFSHFNDRFLVSAPGDLALSAQQLLYKFYAQEAKRIFSQRLNALWPGFCIKLSDLYPDDRWLEHPRPQLKVRRMKSRFGSMNSQNKMTLNTELIRVATKYSDYVILHELCHLKYMNHSKVYYLLLEQMLPDWPVLKHELMRLLPL